MANHTKTLADLKTDVLHAWGGNAAATLSTADVVNDSVQWLAEQHPWAWKQKVLSLAFTAAQNYITLPTDFEGISKLVPTSAARVARGVTLHELLTMRAVGTPMGDVGTVYYCLQIVPQASATAEPTWKLELYPTPAATVAGAIIGTYNRILPKLTSDTAIPDIPAQHHVLLKYVCMAKAISQSFQRDSEYWRIASQMLSQAIANDGYGQDTAGQMIGTAMRIRQDADRPLTLRGQLVP